MTNYKFKNNEQFEIEIIITDANIVHFEGCTFKKKVTFKFNFILDVWIKDCTFEDEVIFENCVFEKNVRFYGTHFKKKTNFKHTKFEKLADFWTARFYEKTIFYKTNFEGTTVLAGTVFYENVLFTYTLIDKVIIFRNTEFKKGIDLSLAIISSSSQISWFDNLLNNFKSINDFDDIYSLGDSVEVYGNITHKHKRETFRIIKSHLNNCHNNIDSLDYYGLELEAYREQIKSDYKPENKWKNYFDNLSLYANKYSNQYGQNWGRAFIFTIGVGLLFFIPTSILSEKYSFGIGYPNLNLIEELLGKFLLFLSPIHNFDFIEEIPTGYSILFDFIGRIFIGFGIYQLIQSFRKFKLK